MSNRLQGFCTGKKRSDLQVFEDAEWEAWETLSRRQQIRNGTAARIAITVFATQKRPESAPHTDLSETSSAKRVKFAMNSPDSIVPDVPDPEVTKNKHVNHTMFKPKLMDQCLPNYLNPPRTL